MADFIVQNPDTAIGLFQSVMLLVGVVLMAGILLVVIVGVIGATGNKVLGMVNDWARKVIKKWLGV